MSRSTKKGPYVLPSLMKKVEAMNVFRDRLVILHDRHRGCQP